VRAWNKYGGASKRLQPFQFNAGRKRCSLTTLAPSRIGQDGTNMLVRKAREVLKDFILAHPTSEVLEDIGGCNAGSGELCAASMRLRPIERMAPKIAAALEHLDPSIGEFILKKTPRVRYQMERAMECGRKANA
jgi:hypothetical protein